MNDMKMTILAFTIGLIILYVALVIPQGREIKQSQLETRSGIIHGDNVIYPGSITGLSIRKYAVASTGKQQWEYAVKISGTDQEIAFETRNEAELFMIYLAGETGI